MPAPIRSIQRKFLSPAHDDGTCHVLREKCRDTKGSDNNEVTVVIIEAPRPASPKAPLPLRLTLAQLIPALALALAALLHFAPARAADLDAAMAATLVIYSDDSDEAFLGSAFLWGDGTLALTNQHVIKDAHSVDLRAGNGLRLVARVIFSDAGRDLAVIAVPGAVFGPGLVPAAAPPRIGQPVYALGAPLGAEFSASSGMISATGRQVDPAAPVLYVQHDAAVNPGSSGGPLVDDQGRLVGLNSQIADGSRMFVGIAYAISVADIARLLPQMLDGSLRPVPDLGLRLRPVSRKIAAALGLTEGDGLLVDYVVPGGRADRAGVLAGDVMRSFDGAWLPRPGSLAFAMERRQTDQPEVEIIRQGARRTLSIDLRPAPGVLAKMSGNAGPARVASYTLSGLGIGRDGTRVTGLNPGSPAAFAGLAAGDVILAVDGVPAEVVNLSTFAIEGPLVLLVRRPTGETLHVVIDPWGNGRGPHPVGGANVLDPAVVLF